MSQDKNVGTSKTTEVACVEGGEDNVPTHGDSSSKRERDKNVDPNPPKVYFERQTKHYCGLAALNSLYGYHAFTESALKMIGTLLCSTTEELGVTEDFQGEEGDFSIEILMVAVMACKQDDDGWLSLRYVSSMEMNAEFMINQKKLLVHEKHDVNDLTKGHYYCYMQEHEKYILKDSEERKPKVIANTSMMAALKKIAENKEQYTVFI